LSPSVSVSLSPSLLLSVSPCVSSLVSVGPTLTVGSLSPDLSSSLFFVDFQVWLIVLVVVVLIVIFGAMINRVKFKK